MMTPVHPTNPNLRPSPRSGGRLRSTLAVALLALTSLSVFSVARSADAADDVDLLRENGGNPFVMILLDTSASMALLPPESSDSNRYFGDLATGNADDPHSKLFQVKQALYEVFSQVENVSFGFATYNMDHARVLRKHWLYAPTASVDHTVLTYPVAGATQRDNRSQLESHWVFGSAVGRTQIGTCAAPIVFSTANRDNTDIQLNRFPKNIGGGATVRHWIQVGTTTYALDVTGVSGSLGDPEITVRVTLSRLLTCGSPVTVDIPVSRKEVTFDLVTDFLMVEADTTNAGSGGNFDRGVESSPAIISNGGYLADNCKQNETLAGYLDLQDIAADGTCGGTETQPFTGRGAEMNTDSGVRASQVNVDPFCASGNCSNLRLPTVLHPKWPELDFGDFIPLDWEADHREDFLKRLNPRHPDAPVLDEPAASATEAEWELYYDELRQYYGVATFFEDTADPSTGLLPVRDGFQTPIMAFGNSPLARAVSDFRCWFNEAGSNRCKEKFYEDGFEKLFLENDSAFKCRIPYLITITDGEENSKNEDSAADFNDLDGKYGIRNWIFSFQDHPDFQPIKSNANAEVILVTDKNDLKRKLEEVIGTITQATRTFATAAVPSVQASVESRIYLTKFQPLNDAGVWEGHMHAFRLPMPDRADVPNSAYPNHIWDAASAILAQAPDLPDDGNLAGVADLQLGAGANQRRVFWAQDKVPDSLGRPPLPAADHLFDLSSELGSPLEQDLWKALDLSFDLADADTVTRARARADNIVRTTLVEKESPLVSDTDDLDFYVLGDVFHSNPLVLGGPVNTRYFVEDAEETFDGSGTEQGTGYREFFNRHENRRKVLLAGANDGQLHAFEAGVPGIHTETLPDGAGVVKSVRFTEGSGRELFSFIPDEAMATVKLSAENPQTHRWGVDGSPAAGDVFIDPVHDGAPAVADREWRTVVVTGMREGGTSYSALDMTFPDPLTTATIGRNNEPVAERDVSLIQGYQTSSSGPTLPGEAPDPGLSEEPTDTALIVPGCYANPGGCDGIQYPRMLWEFRDRVWDPSNLVWVPLDEDGNGFADLGETWSTPDIGRIRVQSGGTIVNKYVSVFGGGLDPAKADSRGNWIYMVDMETGQAIYKRQLEGSAPSDPAAVDTDQDGFFDRIYIGTTAGKLYRVDLAAVDSLGNVVYPVLESQKVGGVRGLDGITYTTTAPPRIEDGTPAEPLWEPRLIFDTSAVIDGDTVARPIYYPPSVLFLADLGEFALALGTGDRDDLTSRDGTSGRFYVFVDETDQIADADLPMTESDLEQIDRGEGDNDNLLTDPNLPVGQKGWFLVLSDKERLIGDPFGFSGVTFFATFEADIEASCQVTCPSELPEGETCTKCNKPDKDGVLSPDETPQCTIGGLSRIYVVGTTDADAFLTINGTLSRAYEIPGQFVTSPFTEQAVTRTITTEEGEVVEADPLDEQELENMKKLMELFPERCKFGNHRIDVKVIRADSEIERIAAVPICIVEKNWKELGE